MPQLLDLDVTIVALDFGRSITVTPVVFDQDGVEIPEASVEWSSSDPTVATVSEGVITGTGVGEATITALAGAVEEYVQVTVSNAPTSIAMEEDAIVMWQGQSLAIPAVVLNESNEPMDSLPPGYEVGWVSDGPSVVTVDANGTITAIGSGEAVVRAELADLPNADLQVRVSTSVAGVAISDAEAIMRPNESVTVTAAILDEQGDGYYSPPPGYDITWSSSNTSLATVDDGTITGLAEGRATVFAHAGELTPREITVRIGATYQLAFEYRGDRNGTVSIFGLFVDTGRRNWAVTYYDPDFDDQDIMARMRRSDGRWDLLWLWVDGRVTAPDSREVLGVVFWSGFAFDNLDSAERIYAGDRGSVNFRTVASNYMAGTFSMPGMINVENGANFRIGTGTFDVPRVDVIGSAPAVAGAAATPDTELPGELHEFRRAAREMVRQLRP